MHGIDLKIADGELLVIAPLRLLPNRSPCACWRALETISGGEVRIGDKIVNNLAPKSRDIAMVFQNYALIRI